MGVRTVSREMFRWMASIWSAGRTGAWSMCGAWADRPEERTGFIENDEAGAGLLRRPGERTQRLIEFRHRNIEMAE